MLFNSRKSGMLSTIQLKEFVWERLKSSKTPIDEIIPSDVYFSDKVYMTGIYLYSYKRKYCMRFVTQYKREETLNYFDSPDDLLFSLLKYIVSQKAIYETGGYKYKELALEYFKSIDDKYYNRALIDFNNDSW